MFRKKAGGQHLEPLKINKTEANYQFLLLEMMSNLVKEQKESNKLLRKLVGGQSQDEPSNHTSILSAVSPIKKRQNPVDSNMSVDQKQNQMFLDKEHIQSRAHSQHAQEVNFYTPSDAKSERASRNQEKQRQEEKEQLGRKVDVLAEILNKIESHMERSVQLAEESAKNRDMEKLPQVIKPEPNPTRASKPISLHQSPQPENITEEFSIYQKENPSKKKIDINKLNNIVSPIKDTKDISTNLAPKIQSKASELLVDKLVRYSTTQQTALIRNQEMQKEMQQRKNYAILSQILPYSDRRQIKIKFSVEDIVNYYLSKGQKVEIEKITEEWLGLVYRATASICWNMLSNNLLSFDETKILFTENIIFNFIECMKSIKGLGYATYRVELVENINSTSVNILDFLCTQYPQTKVEDPNIALRSQIPSIDNKNQVKYDIIGKVTRNRVVSFRRKKTGDYTQQIMKTINFMIDRTNDQYQNFSKMMTGIFEEIFIPYKKRKHSRTEIEETHEDQLYYEKVKSYTKFLIGRKINKNTPKYSKPEIQNGIFFVKSPAILRIITKWVEQLDEIVRHPQKEIKNSNREFKDDAGLPLHLYGQVKNGVYKAIKQNQQKFQEKVRCIKRQCYHMEVLLTLQKFITQPEQIHLSQEQISVGKYCTYLKSAIASYICSELNQLIDFLLEIPYLVDQTKIGITEQWFQEQCRKDLDNLNLVSFKIFDLLRCKCISKESEILYLLRRLNQKSNDPSDPFVIIRIKDRLANGTRDILINAQISRGVPCEIQLAVASNMEKKQEMLDQYNHFLYELKRAKLGSITQSSSIWSTLQQRAKFFELYAKKDIHIRTQIEQHSCIAQVKRFDNRKISKFQRPIICASCNNFLDIPKTCLSNIKCDQCLSTYCGQCHLQHLREQDKKQFVFEKDFFKCLFPCIRQYKDYKKPLPKYGFLIRKYYLKKQLLFYRVISKKSSDMEKKNEMSLELVISGVENNIVFNKTINKHSIEANLIKNELYLTEFSSKIFENYIIYEVSKFGKGVEKISMSYKQLLENYYESRIKYVNLMRHPVYVEDLKVLKKPKVILQELNSLKAVPQNSQITILKIYKTIFILQIEQKQEVLQQQLVKILNINSLRSYALDKSNSVSMEFRQVTDQMDLIRTKFPKQLMQSFSQRLTKLYLNFGMIQQLTFLDLFPLLKVFYISNNKLKSLKGIECLEHLTVLVFDNNNIESLEPISQLIHLNLISGTDNDLVNVNGLKKLTALKKLNLTKNKITNVDDLQTLTIIKQLSLNSNPITSIKQLMHLKDLQDLNVGKTNISDLEDLTVFKKLKKLSLNGLNLTSISPIFKRMESLVKLNLSENQIEKIQNLEELNELIELNLRNNRIAKIQKLQNCAKLQTIKLSYNRITDVTGIKNLDNIKVLKMYDNPLNDCSQFHSMSRKHFRLYFSGQGKASKPENQPTIDFYERYNAVIQNKVSSGSGSNDNSDSD